ncbi:MAG: hypothetical protein WDA65_00910 [Christensenellales bacterium]
MSADPTGITGTQEYDIAGRLVNKHGGGAQITYVYDNIGNVLSTADKAGVTAIISSSAVRLFRQRQA